MLLLSIIFRIESIDIVENSKLRDKFEKKQAEFRNENNRLIKSPRVSTANFTTSDYSQPNDCFDNNKLKNREENFFKLFKSFKFSNNVFFSGRLLIGQNDSLNVLLLDQMQFKKGRNYLNVFPDRPILFVCLRALGVPSKAVLVFHGTKSDNIRQIIEYVFEALFCFIYKSFKHLEKTR